MGIQYKPELDGLRALAVLAVVVFHARVPGFNGGWIGVDVFFVLSGYLITQVLLANPDLPTFYWRRFKRLVPPFALMLAAYLWAAPKVEPNHPHWRDALAAFFHLSDYTLPLYQFPDYLRHTWSLAIEEQFYLLWPLILLRKKPGFTVLIAAWAALTVWKFQWGWSAAYTRFDTHCTGLVLGCALAMLPRFNLPTWPFLLGLLGCVLVFKFNDASSHETGVIVVELFTACILLGNAPKWLSARSLVYLGKLSYGIYLWHFALAYWMHKQGMRWDFVLAASTLFGVGMAALSYHTLEALFRSNRPALDAAARHGEGDHVAGFQPQLERERS
ncbi:acyltransferase family protein [Noviluteimonas dokdonensis]|uniref:acyltransferase family protein n=1 Tax=Noviluteimonas dokdonensis TaxID=414050 RepID=UPI00068E6708|nr:acyltransferase [Lysobacter dokdonensis]